MVFACLSHLTADGIQSNATKLQRGSWPLIRWSGNTHNKSHVLWTKGINRWVKIPFMSLVGLSPMYQLMKLYVICMDARHCNDSHASSLHIILSCFLCIHVCFFLNRIMNIMNKVLMHCIHADSPYIYSFLHEEAASPFQPKKSGTTSHHDPHIPFNFLIQVTCFPPARIHVTPSISIVWCDYNCSHNDAMFKSKT